MPTGVVSIKNAAGQLVEVDGYSDSGVLLWANKYDGPTGRLIEQDGYDSAGNRATVISINTDGTKAVTVWDSTGRITEQDTFDANGAISSSNQFFAGGTKQVTAFAAGIPTLQTGYDASGNKSYVNLFYASGALREQDGYTANVKTIAIEYASDGGKTVTQWNSSGTLVEKDVFDAGGKTVSTLTVNADGTSQASSFAAGVLTQVIGYDAQSHKIWSNSFNAQGGIVEQAGYSAATGVKIYSLLSQTNGSLRSIWDSSGHLQEVDQLNLAGVVTKATSYAADGSSTVVLRDSSGNITQTGAYSASSNPIYINKYDGPTGRLTEQDGFDNSGNKTTAVLHNADGSKSVTLWDSTGRVTESDTFDVNGKIASSNQFFADGTSQVTSFAAGVPTLQTGYSAAGPKAYVNMFSATGALVEQDGFDPNGTKTLAIVKATDGSRTVTQWNNAGTLLESDKYDASGVVLSTQTRNADGSSQISTFNGGVINKVVGYGTTGMKAWDNDYNAQGVLIDQNGYSATTGNKTFALVINVDGSVLQTNWNDAGVIQQVQSRNAAGFATSTTNYAADGSSTLTLRDATGHLTEQDGFSSTNKPSFVNKYDLSGNLTEKDTYNTSGNLTSTETHGASGGLRTLYDGNGHVTETDVLNTSNVATKTSVFSADGSSVVTLRTDTGQIFEIDGFDKNNNKSYINTYDTATGKAVKELGYYSDGNLKQQFIHAADGSGVQTFYDDATGKVTATENYDATGRMTHANTPFLGDATYQFWAQGANVGPNINTSGLKLTFDDEFNSFSSSPNGGAMWKTTLAGGGRTYTTTGEVEYYSDSSVGVNPFSVGNGVLNITAHAASAGQVPSNSNMTWTSGVITTESSFAQEYGYFEIRAQLPTGAGIWPGFWTLPAGGGWPPELDVVEAIGSSATTVYGSTHGGTIAAETTLSNAIDTSNISQGFHTYGVLWKPDTITWYIDNVAVATEATPSDLHRPMYMIADLAVGGDGSWPGPVDGSISSATMSIDYVRAYQTADTVVSGLNLTGSAANPNLVGLAGNDQFALGSGTISVDGGAGTNTASIATSWTKASWQPGSNGAWTLTTDLGTVSLANIASVAFQDVTIKLSGTTLTGVDAFGTPFWTDTFAVDGSSKVEWYANGAHIEEDVYNSAGVKTQVTAFATDGSTTVINSNSAGQKLDQTGYTASGTPTYRNAYNSLTGALSEQDSYNASGNKIQVQTFAADQSSTVQKFNAGGQLIEQDSISASSVYLSQDLYAADRSHTLTLRNASGVVIEQDGFSAANLKTYTNLYDGVSGKMTEQDGYDASGNKISVQKFQADMSSALTRYNASGVVTEKDSISANGVTLSQDVYAADGSHTLTLRNANNQITEQDGLTASNVKTYVNLYDPASARLIEQDGYDASGHKTSVLLLAADGSKVSQQYNASGALLEKDQIASNGVRISASSYQSDGSYTTTLHNTAGALTEQDGYSSANVKLYSNIYDPASGRLVEQDGFDANGNKTQITLRAADGSYSVSNYDATGVLTSASTLNSQNQTLSTTTKTAGGYSVAGARDGAILSGTTGNDTFTGGGASQTFVFSGTVGKDVIANFHAGTAAGHDVIKIDHTLIADYATLLSHTHDVGSDTVITIDASDTITLSGLHMASFNSADFVFI